MKRKMWARWLRGATLAQGHPHSLNMGEAGNRQLGGWTLLSAGPMGGESGELRALFFRVLLAGRQECRGSLWFRRVGLKGADFGAKVLDRSFIWLVLAGGGVVAGALVEQAEKADGVHRTKLVSEDGDPLAVEVDGAGVSRGAHEISGGGELDRIENGDG